MKSVIRPIKIWPSIFVGPKTIISWYFQPTEDFLHISTTITRKNKNHENLDSIRAPTRTYKCLHNNPEDTLQSSSLKPDIKIETASTPIMAFSVHRVYNMTRSSGDHRNGNHVQEMSKKGPPPAEQFAPLASKFGRRLTVGVGSASLVGLGANFCGVTSFLLGLNTESGRSLKLDVVYPIGGYSRCVDANEGFEFIYPARWVGDQALLYRAAEKKEQARSLDLPPLDGTITGQRRRKDVNEPVVAFGPPGSNGELNVSVIVSPVPRDFSIEAFGGPNEVGEAVVRTITGSGRRPDIKGTLIQSSLRKGLDSTNYYELEFRIESPTFQRHNVAVCCATRGRLYTLNAQAPESAWPNVKMDFQTIADSFILIS